MNKIHELVVVEKGAVLGDNIEINPFCSIGSEVVIEDNVKIHEHVVIKGKTVIGAGTEIYPFASIGLPPQDLKYRGERSETIIGKNCQIREHVTIHAGTASGIMLTKVGDNCLLMAGSHVAHDCIVGNEVIIANCAALAGHVVIDDFCIIGGLAAILQFVRIGKYAMICGMTGVTTNVPPFAMVFGNRGYLSGLNLVGMKRRGFTREEIKEINSLYKIIFFNNELSFKARVEAAKERVNSIHGQEIINFLSENSKKNFCQPRMNNEAE
ncbi:acyl-ACP--UDP-N-acetylglucosamine O-acyltransferase [Legionella jordanis]|uniref:Acyl-[acyl-carrier-protein]--UDP-N-acetylglucosamine O-acyltransferase n=1 Tax=Legionella jordanis TaxID=456 RepID=A0A0W0V9S2_9GAMM|nr:acyl-ACP--UDP-N-acetylglucosamine O-acyltransferase [Legionella jordanis]KTD16883.1 UDP-N-acetylglucosamine acyltransferase [Legionella jordanis]VEH13580.1 acyl-(acyl carrier protein)-UDP-N-acetylglucosamine acyltransferase [Legionella jordanis]